MARRPSTQSSALTVEQYIGSAYDSVKLVGDNLDIIQEVAAGLTNSLKYLGAHTIPPTERLDGSPLEDGDYYFDPTDGQEALIYYDLAGTSWFKVDPSEVINARDQAVQAATDADADATTAAVDAVRAETAADRAEAIEPALRADIDANTADITANDVDIAALQGRNISTSSNSGLKGGGDLSVDRDLALDISGTAKATTAVGSDLLILEQAGGVRKSISRDDLLSGLGGGIELRGFLSPTSSWGISFNDTRYVDIPLWIFAANDEITFRTIYSPADVTTDYEYVFDSTSSPRAYLRADLSGNWDFDAAVIDVEVNGSAVAVGDVVTYGIILNCKVTFKQATGIARIGADVAGSFPWEGYIEQFDGRGTADGRYYPLTISQFTDPATTVVVDTANNQDGSLNSNGWEILPYEDVTGDLDNTVIGLGTAPQFMGLTPAGYTYVVLLEEADKATGVKVRIGGDDLFAPVEWTVFDQDQVSWLGSAASGVWTHLATGDSVLSVFGRVGQITAQAGDYDSTDINIGASIPNVNGSTVAAALTSDVMHVRGNQSVSGTKTVSGTFVFDGSTNGALRPFIVSTATVEGQPDLVANDVPNGISYAHNDTALNNIPTQYSTLLSVKASSNRGFQLVSEGIDSSAVGANMKWRSIHTGQTDGFGPWREMANVDDVTTLTDALDLRIDGVSVDLSVLSASAFEAAVENNRRRLAGSGFEEWGKQHVSNANINQGMYERVTFPNNLLIGRRADDNSVTGTSRTGNPIVTVAGVRHDLSGTTFDDTGASQIVFPPAEQGTRSFDSATGETLDYLVDVDPKYGNTTADVSEAVARNFEGVLRNGDFRFGDDSNWTGLDTGISIGSGFVECDGTNTAKEYLSNTGGGSLEDGAEYEMSLTIMEISAGIVWMTVGGGSQSSAKWDKAGTYTWRFTANNSAFTSVHPVAFEIGCVAKVTNCSLRKVTTQLILTRQDFAFLETFDQLVSKYDVVLPLGNTQSGVTTTAEGISTYALTSYGVAQPYSGFGDWDTDTAGRGIQWSTLSEADRKAFLANPWNNVRQTEDGLVQRCYRVRTLRGFGDEWESVRPNSTTSVLRYSPQPINTIKAQGQSTTSDDFINSSYSEGRYVNSFLGSVIDARGLVETVTYVAAADNAVGLDGRAWAYKGNCFALPIALVQRGNQGAYHPEYNPNGFSRFAKIGVGVGHWYQHEDTSTPYGNLVYSTKDCLTVHVSGRDGVGRWVDSGSIGSASGTGRSDQYDFYDAIYAGQVQDLRINANKQDSSRLLEDRTGKSFVGTTRGKGKVPFSTVHDDAGAGSDPNASRKYINHYQKGIQIYTDTASIDVSVGDWYYLYDADKGVLLRTQVARVLNNYFDDGEFESSTLTYLQGSLASNETGSGSTDVYYILEKELTPEYDSLPWMDVNGDPARIKATFPSGFSGQWTGVIPIAGTTVTPLSRKAETFLFQNRTRDDGASWTAIGNTLNSTVNSISNSTVVGEVNIIQYEALANFTGPTDPSALYGTAGDVLVGGHAQVDTGNRLMPSLTGEIGKSGGFGNNQCIDSLSVTSAPIKFGLYQTTIFPLHTPLRDLPTNNGSDSFKALPKLVDINGLLYVQYHGSQLIYDTNWGDDNQIPIVWNESTRTDTNGNTVRTFTHTEQFPVGIADYTETN